MNSINKCHKWVSENKGASMAITGGIALLLVILNIFGATGGSGASAPFIGGGVYAEKSVSDSYGVDQGFSAQISRSAASSLPPISPDPLALGEVLDGAERKVIQNGSLSMVVDNTGDTIGRIKDVAKALEGFVAQANVWETGDDKKAGSITIRVPGDKFDNAFDQIKGLAIKVTREDINASDVTEQFVDLEAQLKNLKASETQYLAVLTRASKIEDILAVRRELDQVRSQVERIQGRLNYLSRQIAMSTISVSLVSEADVEVFGVVWSPIQEIKQAVRDMLQGITGFIDSVIAFIFFLPVLALWIGVLALVIWLLKKVHRHVKMHVKKKKK